MLSTLLKGRLGNQMFQYAAVRSLANDIGAPFKCRQLRPSLGYTRLACRLRSLIKRKAFEDLSHLNQHNLLYAAYGLESFTKSLARELIGAKEADTRNTFSPKRDKFGQESYDAHFHELTDPAKLEGWFQSERYFRHHREEVLRWFTPRSQWLAAIKQAESELPASPERRCAIHIRLGDYKQLRNASGSPGSSWCLPLEYYTEAIKQLPDGLEYIVFSDEPDEAIKLLKGSNVSIRAVSHAPVIDMFLIARCHYKIIANSSFSWWGAWLGDINNDTVIAPLYHNGKEVKQWIPEGIQVREWTYI